jgi:predicted cation transporter
MEGIAAQPVAYIVAGLSLVTLAVLVLPFVVKFIEHNLELFFLASGVATVTISGLWSWNIVKEALKAPLVIGSTPIGIFQVVLVVGLLMYYFNKPIYRGILYVVNRLGYKLFVFLVILVLGLLSSLMSVILAAVLLSEILLCLPIKRTDKIKFAVVACFAIGLGAVLTPLGEPLSTILVYKLSGPPYYAGFTYPLTTFAPYVIPGVIIIAIFGIFYLGRKESNAIEQCEMEPSEGLKGTIVRALKVYVFVAALILLGEGLKPIIIWYLVKVPAVWLYWINTISAVLDNATLTAVEIGPTMSPGQIISAIMGLLIAGGMMVPGNIPNIVTAARLKISMKEWAVIGLPMGFVIMAVYFVILLVLGHM